MQSSSQEIEEKQVNKTDRNLFYLVLELFKWQFMKNHLSVRIGQTLGSIIKGNDSISYGDC